MVRAGKRHVRIDESIRGIDRHGRRRAGGGAGHGQTSPVGHTRQFIQTVHVELCLHKQKTAPASFSWHLAYYGWRVELIFNRDSKNVFCPLPSHFDLK